MDSIGAEVGQKMRSAIKAKLMELDCYVDDELPDYIMVMVANKRTKSQMNEDLNLFLSTKTSTFVNWLHIVLKKLKEVTVTNPEVYKKAIKRKSNEVGPDDKSSLKLKKEKSHKKLKKESHSERSDDEDTKSSKNSTSITDDLPLSANKLSDNRKIIITDNTSNPTKIAEDNFDIPLLSEVSESNNEEQLQDLERKIKNVKSRLGLLVDSDEEGQSAVKSEQDQNSAQSRQIDVIEGETEHFEEIDGSTSLSQDRHIELGKDSSEYEDSGKSAKRTQHKRITYEAEPDPVPVRSRLDRTSRDKPKDSSRDRSKSPGKKPSILDRLGKRLGTPDRSSKSEGRHLGYHSGDLRRRSSSRDRSTRMTDRLSSNNVRKRNHSKERNRSHSRDRSPLRSSDKNKDRGGILSRLGVQSKVSVIKKPVVPREESDEEEEKVVREVSSAIKVKPRVLPSKKAQANKNLLLKAVADAQRSVAQTPKVGKEVKEDILFTKKYSETRATRNEQKDKTSRNAADTNRNNLRDIIKQSSNRMRSRAHQSSDEYDSDGEYIPQPVKKIESCRSVPNYVPSLKNNNETESKENDTKENGKQQFIITLDGIEKLGFAENNKNSIKSRLEDSVKKRSSPIVFDKTNNVSLESKPSRSDIPDILPIVHTPLAIKHKERCRYWPSCRQGDKCEFAHPSENCQMFPQCKFGDKCLFIHPNCKFGSSCTKRDCPYDHNFFKTATSLKLPSMPAVQNCKFFPNCTNSSCPFYHPKPCKYGKYCKNISDCGFSHSIIVNKKNMIWKSQ